MSSIHRLEHAELKRAAHGTIDGPGILRLRASERDRRLLLLRRILDRAADSPAVVGPLAPVAEVWDLVVELQEHASPIFEDLISHPYTGAWLGHVSRRLRGLTTGVEPLWVDVGYVHALVAAGAVRAGRTLQTRIPIRDRYAILPTLGMAMFATRPRWAFASVEVSDGDAVVRADNEQVWIPPIASDDAAGWWGLRRHAAHHLGITLTVTFEDLDPFRGLYGPIPPGRLSEADARIWRGLIDEAWRLLTTCLPETAAPLSAAFTSLAVSPASGQLRPPSASTGEAFGSAVLSRPLDGATLGAMLAHEYRHIQLGAIMNLVPLHDHTDEERFYTPWRDDPRPLGGVVQGVSAFAGVAGYWRALTRSGLHTPWSTFEFVYWRDRVWETVEQVRHANGLTPAGYAFLTGVAESIAPWRAESVPLSIAVSARLLAAEHRTGWRIRHVRPAPETIEHLVARWGGEPSRPPAAESSTIALAATAPPTTGRTARVLRALSLLAGGPTRASAPTDAELAQGDMALIAQRYHAAVRHFRSAVAEAPDRYDAWVGVALALTGSAEAQPVQARVLLERPELVQAVFARLRIQKRMNVDPVHLAGWIGACLDADPPDERESV